MLLFQQFQDVDTEELRACERLIHDQHLQQQGWAAVVANLEDVTRLLPYSCSTLIVIWSISYCLIIWKAKKEVADTNVNSHSV